MSPVAAQPPLGWKSVSALGIRLFVPETWPVRQAYWTPCGVDAPLVDLDAPRSGPIPLCFPPGFGPGAEVIVELAGPTRLKGGRWSSRTLAGLHALVSASRVRQIVAGAGFQGLLVTMTVTVVAILDPRVTVMIRVGTSQRLPGGRADEQPPLLRRSRPQVTEVATPGPLACRVLDAITRAESPAESSSANRLGAHLRRRGHWDPKARPDAHHGSIDNLKADGHPSGQFVGASLYGRSRCTGGDKCMRLGEARPCSPFLD